MKKNMKKTLLTLAIITILPACSTFKALSQDGPADIVGIGTGTPREEIISRIGAPKITETFPNQLLKQDIFEFRSGMNQASKMRVIPYLAADVFSAFLAELIIWPLELGPFDAASCTAIATYDGELKVKVKSWTVSKKNDSSAQSC